MLAICTGGNGRSGRGGSGALLHCTALNSMLPSQVLVHVHQCLFHVMPLLKSPHAFALCTWKQLQNIYMINICCWRDKVCSSVDKWEHIDHFILSAIAKFNIPLESISEIESIFFLCVPACSLFSRSKVHFWLITNALRSWIANVFVECQLMLSDKCLKLSQSSCPSFRLCQTSPLVEADNSYTGGDWAVCSLKGLTLPHEAGVRWKKHQRCFNWNFKNTNFCILPILNANEISFLHWGLSARCLQCLPSHLVPRLPASFDKLLCLLKISDKVFLHRARTGKKSCQQN